MPELVTLGSVTTCAMKSICESKWRVTTEPSRDACRRDIAVAPTRMATMKTMNRPLRNPNGIKSSETMQTRQGDTALCNKAPDHKAVPRANAL